MWTFGHFISATYVTISDSGCDGTKSDVSCYWSSAGLYSDDDAILGHTFIVAMLVMLSVYPCCT